MKIISLIPARGGSKRLPKKNIKLFCGKPLIHHTIEKCLMFSDEVWISSDDDKILEVSRQYKSIHTLKRPSEISKDNSTPNEYMLHFFDNVNIENDDIIILCQCTSPLVNWKYYEKGINMYKKGNYDTVVSVYKDKRRCYSEKGKLLLGNDFVYKENGAFYVFSKKNYLKNNCEIGGKIGFVEIPKLFSIDIDEENDFLLAEVVATNTVWYNKFNP